MSTVSKLSKLCAASTAIAGIALISAPAQAAEFYNCSNPTGCELVSNDKPSNDLTKTKYPVVLAHGLGGWTSLFKILDYYNGIPEALMSGGSDVFTTKTSSFTDAEIRGEQLLQQVQTITAITGKPKVNLFGHSHGGSDIRYVAAVAPDQVASVTAVSTPAQGSAMADWVVETAERDSKEQGYADGEYNFGTKAAVGFFNIIGNVMDLGSGIGADQLQEQDALGSIYSLTTDYMTNYYNVKYPAGIPSEYCGQPPSNNVVNGIPYYSFSGVGGVYNPFDPTDYIMGLTGLAFENDPNDGLVSSCSSRVGYVIRDDYKMNHLDTVNQLLGMVAWGRADPVGVYRNQVNRLKNEGY